MNPDASLGYLTHVVAGVITDARGRILLARRLAGRELAGLWEFPGGKVEPGETPQAALIRELREELGIEAEVDAPVICVPHAMPHKRLRLEVYRIRCWQGTPKGCEGQALAWIAPDKLPRYAMPAPDRPVVAALMQPAHYAITPTPTPAAAAAAADDDDDAAWLEQVKTAVTCHAITRLQLRLPSIDLPRQRHLLTQLLARPALRGVEVLVNGNPALAQEFDLGLHLNSTQLHDESLRPALNAWPAGRPLAASCHTLKDLQRAKAIGGCHFVVLGPVLPTASHPDAPGIGWDGFAALRERCDLPIYALGGLSPDDIHTARQYGAQGIAAIRAFFA